MKLPDPDGRGVQLGASSKATARVLRVIANVVVVLAPLGLVVPRNLGVAIAQLIVGLLIVIPVVRVLWLASRWFRLRDVNYALVAVGLASVIIGGAVMF